MKKLISYLIFCICTIQTARAQHFQFSQFYAAPTYLNPAFTGANVCSRFSLNYRNQWSGIPGTFTSYQASMDHYLKKIKSGIGVQFFSDKAGLGDLSTTQVSLLYAYEARLNKRTMGRGGIQLGHVQRKVDFGAFTFGDQLENGSERSSEGFADARVNYFDVGMGFLVYTQSTWLGFSSTHLNKPNQSLLNNTSPLPTELKLHGGYKMVFAELESANRRLSINHSVTFAFNYKKQNKFNQLDLGIYYNKDLFSLGLWYRGLPFFKPEYNYANSDAVILLFGLNYGKYKVGYSYDITVSKLLSVNTRGSHELSMSYQFCNIKKSRRKKNILISCPKF